MAPLKVLISGGGIAGNAIAFWLSKLGHDVTVIERFSSLRATGLQIDLRGHGIEVMRRMGLEEAFRSKCVPEQGLQIVDSSGTRRAFFPANKSGKGLQSFTTDFEIMRGDLCRLIYNATMDRAKYIFGTSIESFEQKDNIVAVRFADGRSDTFDLVVGADGQGSRTRKIMYGPGDKDHFHPLGSGGEYLAYFTISRPIEAGEQYFATAYMATGGRGIMTRRHNPTELQVYLGCRIKSKRLDVVRGDVKEEKEVIVEIFQGAGWETDKILEGMRNSKDFYCEHMGLVKLDSWSRGHIALLGDAAYCPSANTGMGTTSAMVGAYILAGEIGRHYGNSEGHVETDIGIAAALKAYEERFQPFMTQVQAKVTGQSKWDGFMGTSFGIGLLNYFLGVASFLKVDLGKWMLAEEVKGWDLPDYEELLRK